MLASSKLDEDRNKWGKNIIKKLYKLFDTDCHNIISNIFLQSWKSLNTENTDSF